MAWLQSPLRNFEKTQVFSKFLSISELFELSNKHIYMVHTICKHKEKTEQQTKHLEETTTFWQLSRGVKITFRHQKFLNLQIHNTSYLNF